MVWICCPLIRDGSFRFFAPFSMQRNMVHEAPTTTTTTIQIKCISVWYICALIMASQTGCVPFVLLKEPYGFWRKTIPFVDSMAAVDGVVPLCTFCLGFFFLFSLAQNAHSSASVACSLRIHIYILSHSSVCIGEAHPSHHTAHIFASLQYAFVKLHSLRYYKTIEWTWDCIHGFRFAPTA